MTYSYDRTASDKTAADPATTGRLIKDAANETARYLASMEKELADPDESNDETIGNLLLNLGTLTSHVGRALKAMSKAGETAGIPEMTSMLRSLSMVATKLGGQLQQVGDTTLR